MAGEVWVEMSRVSGFAPDWFRSNVRGILQYIVKGVEVLKSCKM